MSSHRTLDEIMAAVTALVHEAHALGGAEASERIMQAAAGLSEPRATAPPPPKPKAADRRANHSRVTPGTIRPAVRRVLAAEDGLITAEVGRRVTEIDPRISRTSVTNELQRNRGKFYQRRRGRWYLLPIGEEQRDTAEVAANDPPPLMNGTAG